MELFVIGAAFLFLLLITASVMIGVSYVVYRDRLSTQSNLHQIGANFSQAMTEFNKGIEANNKLAQDLNTKLEEVDNQLTVLSNLDTRVQSIEHVVKLKSAGVPRTTLRN